ncbi:Monocarboxylate transporter 10 [Smittium culicis]|uniref:Monocarboxylate transporter 10 n=2 Tax=Smittium culicis TaxID=133412 RepID=A0A1R1XQY7_9FUNG|nr:Monocarboxylate transporter 10 [Smittium culicis]
MSITAVQSKANLAENIGQMEKDHESIQSNAISDDTDATPQEKPAQQAILPPDTGYAWVILAAGTLNFMISFGSFNAFGVFSTFYLLTIFKEFDADVVAWISNVTITMTLVGGLATSFIISKIGIRNTCYFGTVVGTIGLILSSFSTKIWQLVITQGIIYGFGSSLLVNISLLMQALWFEKKMGLAIGIISSGGGFGSLIMVPLITTTVSKLGISWSFRILAIVYFVSTGIGGFLLKTRFDFKPNRKVIDFRMLKDPFLSLLNAAGFFLQVGYTVPLLYFPASLKALGYSQSFSTNFIMVYSVASIIGRLGSGQLADHIQPLYILIFCHFVTGVSMLSLWYFGKSIVAYTIFYIIYGLCGVNFFSVSPSMVSARYPIKRVSQANALSFLFLGISVFLSIPLVGLAFQRLGQRVHFEHIIIIGGSCFLISTIFLVILKLNLHKFPIPTE